MYRKKTDGQIRQGAESATAIKWPRLALPPKATRKVAAILVAPRFAGTSVAVIDAQATKKGAHAHKHSHRYGTNS